jgi:copper oxidase (laccase) domain-containing protein
VSNAASVPGASERVIDRFVERDGVHGWRCEIDGVSVRFLGRGTPAERDAPLPGSWLPAGVERGRLRQVHGDRVQEGRRGGCGEGDGLVTSAPRLALEIATADCVPILFAGRGPAPLARLGGGRGLRAFVGPAIGPCCYEVEEEVARSIAAASPGAEVIAARSTRGRPHVDVVAATVAQLARCGVEIVARSTLCTRCRPEILWSYRRDGVGAGRNLALVWR